MVNASALLKQRAFGETQRKDVWWAYPALVFVILSSFLVYATWAAFQNGHYTYGPYLSPFYSPEIFGDSPHAWFGPRPGWWPAFIPFSPALLILPFPAGFRLTCYYYRGAYYKSFWGDPPSCAVGEPPRGKHFRGEAKFPLILQNIHRYFMYAAIIFILLLAHDAWKAMWFTNPTTGQEQFGIGVGTLVLTLNVVLLSGYTFGCHSLRNLVGGALDQITKAPVRHQAYACVSCLNRKHMNWAWTSLFGVAFADIYVRMCSMGYWTDWRIF